MCRPKITPNLNSMVFRNYYYLKEELVAFCRDNHLPTNGGEIELTQRISYFLDTKKALPSSSKKSVKANMHEIHENAIIEEHFVCSQKHRAFFEEKIGTAFSFKVGFQKWLKANAGKTYQEAVEVYLRDFSKMPKGVTSIDKQFEFNTYIRDFFEDNQGKKLEDAILCWKYKRSLPGHNRYEASDCEAAEAQDNRV